MTKNAKQSLFAALGTVVVLAVLYGLYDLYQKRQTTIDCGDGPRRQIDIRDFSTRYSAYSVELEASVADKAKISAKLTPTQLQQLTESAQTAAEFRKYVVAGYDSCAITKSQYAQYEPRFRAIDALAKEINQLLASPTLTENERTKLASLIAEYGNLVAQSTRVE
jgi:hypothetical protein